MARPTLPRFTADVIVTVELSAEDAEHAAQRIAVLVDLIRPRVKASVRATRIGAAEATRVDQLTDARTVSTARLEELRP